MSEAPRLVTAEELEQFPDDDYRYELVEGRVIRMSPVGFEHGRIVMQFGALLHQYVRSRNLGVVLTEVGFKLASNPDTVRAPDIAFIRQDRLGTVPRGFWKGAADLALEVLSPDDRPAEMAAKVRQYLARGVRAVVVVDPAQRTVTAHRPSAAAVTLTIEGSLDLCDVIDGFRCDVRPIFE